MLVQSDQVALDACCGNQPKAAAAVPFVCGPLPGGCDGPAFEQAPRGSVGRDLLAPPPGHRELLGEAPQAPEEQEHRRRRQYRARNQAQGQAEGLGRREPEVHAFGAGVAVDGEGPGDLKVPGAAAPPIKVTGLVNSMPRLLLTLRCSFSAFFADLARQPRQPSGATFSFWPVPLPYPDILAAGGGGQRAWKKRLLNLAVAALDWLYLRRPARAPPGLEAGTPLTKKQWQMIELLGELVGDGYESLVLGPADLGRTASKLEDQDAILGALHRTLLSAERGLPRYMAPHGAPAGRPAKDVAPPDASSLEGSKRPHDRPFGWIAGKLRGKKTIAAKQIVASRVSLPPPPAFDPRPLTLLR